jgi:hypothetical protein
MNHYLSCPRSAILISSKIHEDICNSRCTTGVNSTSGKLTKSVVDTGDKFTINFKDTVGHIFPDIYCTLISATLAKNLPAVSSEIYQPSTLAVNLLVV